MYFLLIYFLQYNLKGNWIKDWFLNCVDGVMMYKDAFCLKLIAQGIEEKMIYIEANVLYTIEIKLHYNKLNWFKLRC